MVKAQVAEYKKHWRERAAREAARQRELAAKARAEARRVAHCFAAQRDTLNSYTPASCNS